MILKPYSKEAQLFANSVVLKRGYEKYREKYIIPYLIYSSPWILKKLRISDLTDEHLINNINHYKNLNDDKSKAFFEIFTDVLVKRRIVKINKIKENIKMG